ncbi:T9SS type A sorting domain-containing protein [bacterium]|nr:T9SS type A sorting domain-containing protein [bacterium]
MRLGLTRLTLVFFAVLLTAWSASALVETEGAVTGTWTSEDNPYIVTGDLIVPEEEFLEIGPGVEVLLHPGVDIIVYGYLTVLGDPKDQVKLTSLDPDEHWGGIRLVETREPTFIQNMMIERTSQGIRVDGGEVELRASHIESETRGLSFFDRSALKLVDLTINMTSESSDARLLDGAWSTITAEDCTFEMVNSYDSPNLVIKSVNLNDVSGSISNSSFDIQTSPTAYAINIVSGSDLLINRCTVTLNSNGSPQGMRPTVIRGVGSIVEIRHLTIDLDSNGWPASAIFAADRARIGVINSIIANTSGHAISDNYPVDVQQGGDIADVVLSYSCLYDMSEFVPLNGAVLDRESIITDDPMWQNPQQGDYHLNVNSPCINAGSSNTGLDPDGSDPDLGRYSYYMLDNGNEVAAVLPEAFELTRAYPNPFNATTRFSVELAEGSQLRVDVFDILGRHVQRIAEGAYAGGRHAFTWDAQSADRPVASGVYLLHVEANGRMATERLVLVR